MKVDNNYSGYSFKGNPSKLVQKIFTDMSGDICDDVIKSHNLSSPKDIFQQLSGFLAQTGPDVVFDYQKPSIIKNFSGFFFKNKKNGKVLPATSRLLFEEPLKENDRLFLKRPELKPENRVTYQSYHNEILDEMHKEYSRLVFHSSPSAGTYYKVNRPISALVTASIKAIFSLFPQRKLNPYNVHNLKSIDTYVKKLITDYKPQDIDNLLL